MCGEPSRSNCVRPPREEDLSISRVNQSQRKILSLLQTQGSEMTPGDVASRLDCSWPTTARHLRVLEDAGLIHVTAPGAGSELQP